MRELEEALVYFRGNGAIKTLAFAFCEKYRRLGRFAGNYRVPKGAGADLSRFFGRPVEDGAAISWRTFAGAWEATRFARVPLPRVLAALAGGELTTRQEEQDDEDRAVTGLLSRLLATHSSGPAATWLRLLQEGWKRGGVHRLAHLEDWRDEALLSAVARALASLPASYERLPFFANRLTGDPHALDEGTRLAAVFLQALSWLHPEVEAGGSEGKALLLYEARLLRDDLQNFVTAYGIVPEGETAPYWRAAAEVFAPFNAPLREIVRAEVFHPIEEGRSVYIVENSGVFSALLDALQEAGRRLPLLCLQGQPKYASWALLDRLEAGGCAFRYAGDYDPEGLLMAQSVLRRYESATPWCYEANLYRPAKPLGDSQLKKLVGVTHPALQGVKEAIQKGGAAFYQESLFELLKEDMLKNRL